MRLNPLLYPILISWLILNLFTAGSVSAQALEGQEYTVQPGDWLSKIAQQFLGSADAFQQIVDATNAKAAADPGFTAITDPNQIEAGQKVWILVGGTTLAEKMAGIYKVMLPGASSPGLDISLYLNPDNSVRQVSDYLNGEAPLVEVGNWQSEGDQVTVTLTGQAGQPYEQPSSETLTAANGSLTSVPTGTGAGRWTYLPFAALATGTQAVPYDPDEAAQLFTAGLTGFYKGFLPAASCCGQDITLLLGINDIATLTTDYLNGEAPIVQTGVWTSTSASAVEVTLAGTETPLSLVVSNGLLVTASDEDAYGANGLQLYRFEVIATNSLEASLAGTVTYLQRMALPPQAVITVQLVDVSLADAPAQVMAEQVITAGGQQPPYNFELIYKPFKIQQEHTYTIQARIEVDDQLKFINTTAYPVLTQGAPEGAVEVIVEPAG